MSKDAELPIIQDTPTYEHIFISYSSKDLEIVETIESHLAQVAQVWRDKSKDDNLRLHVADDWKLQLAKALHSATLVVLVITRNIVDSVWVHAEIQRARELGKKIAGYIAMPVDQETYQTLEKLGIDSTHCLDATVYKDTAVSKFCTDINRILKADSQYQHYITKQQEDLWQYLHLSAQNLFVQLEQSSGKYDHETHLNRHVAEVAFQDFLVKPSTIFVLIGKSGVGKTNFVIKQIGKDVASQDNKLVFILDGARLNEIDILESIYNEISQHRYLQLDSFDGETFINKFAFLNYTDKQVLIVVDAINENPKHPDKIMASINKWALYAYNKKYSWLKFVVTSRPQAWRDIRLKIEIDPLIYYRSNDKNHLSVELYGFEISEYDSSELEEVYKLYAKKYKIRTPIQDLQRVWESLCDPLMLKLVMLTYSKKHYIPSMIASHEILENYIQYLREEKTVTERDFQYLVERIVPLMCANMPFRNYLTHSEIAEHDLELFKYIFYADKDNIRNDVLTQAFRNLMNAEILIFRRGKGMGTGDEDEIRFKYERFYDYYVAEFIQKSLKNSTVEQRQARYLELITYLPDAPYLWGSLQICLVRECEKSSHQLLYELVFTDNQRLRDLLLAVFLEYGQRPQNERSFVENICENILKDVAKKSKFTTKDINAVTMAVQVSEELRFLKFLVDAMFVPMDFVLDSTTSALINLWSSPKSLADAIQVTKQVTKRLSILRWKQFNSTLRNLFKMAVTVFFLKYKTHITNPAQWSETVMVLREMLSDIVDKIPLFNTLIPKSSMTYKINPIRRGLRGLLLRLLLARFVRQIVAQVDDGRLVFDLKSAIGFFRLSREARKKYAPFIGYIHSESPQTVLEVLEPLAKANIEDREMLGAYMCMLPFFGTMRYNALATNQCITRIFDHAFSYLKTNILPNKSYGSIVLANYLIILRNTLIEDDIVQIHEISLDNFGRVVQQVETQFWSRFHTTESLISWMDLHAYYVFAIRMNRPIDYQYFYDFIQQRLQRNDIDSCGRVFHDIMSLGWHSMYRNLELCLYLLNILFDEIPPHVINQHQDIIINDFLRLRSIDAYRVDVFLKEIDKASDEMPKINPYIKQAVQTGKPRYDLGDAIGVAFSWFIRDIMIEKDPVMRKYLQWFLYRALDAKNEITWIIEVANILANGILTGNFPNPDMLLQSYQVNEE